MEEGPPLKMASVRIQIPSLGLNNRALVDCNLQGIGSRNASFFILNKTQSTRYERAMEEHSSKNKKKYFYVYYSYEPWGRGYIGTRECWWPPEEDTSYFGSYTDKTFNPTEKIVIQTFDTQPEAYAAETELHEFYQVHINPHFANRAKQKKCKNGVYAEFKPESKLEDKEFRNKFIKIVNSSTSVKEVRVKLGLSSTGSYKNIKNWIRILNLDISHFKYKVSYLRNKRSIKNKDFQKELTIAIKESFSMTQVLVKLNIKVAGGNFQSLKQWIKQLNLDTSHFTGQGHNKNKKLPKRSESYLEKHHYKYVYTIITPEGELIITKNLQRYCDNNNLNQGCMWSVINGKYKSHKGYTASKEPIDKENDVSKKGP